MSPTRTRRGQQPQVNAQKQMKKKIKAFWPSRPADCGLAAGRQTADWRSFNFRALFKLD